MIVNNKILKEQAEHVEHGLANVQHLMVDAELMAWFAEDFALRLCWSSNAIEGNTLSLDDTVALVVFDEVRAGHTYSEYHDAKNLYHAICSSMIPFHREDITEEWIKNNNRLIRGEDGEYRVQNNRIGNQFETSHIPPDFSRVPGLMKEFAVLVNIKAGSLFDLFKELAVLHMTFERIHPFWDGNGRTGRMILNQQLINYGLLPVAITKKSAYMQAFRQFGRNGDYSKMLHELLKAEEEAIDHLIDFEKKREQGLNWSHKIPLEDQIKAAGILQAGDNELAGQDKQREHSL